jgi:hypothetical protein
MQKQFTDAFALGIIDKDKKDIEYLKEFDRLCLSGSLTLHKHTIKHHYIIQIAPAIERFIIKAVTDSGLKLQDFHLPPTFKELREEAKRIRSKEDVRFKNLFKALEKARAPDIIKLQAWVSYLKDKRYHALSEELVNL